MVRSAARCAAVLLTFLLFGSHAGRASDPSRSDASCYTEFSTFFDLNYAQVGVKTALEPEAPAAPMPEEEPPTYPRLPLPPVPEGDGTRGEAALIDLLAAEKVVGPPEILRNSEIKPHKWRRSQVGEPSAAQLGKSILQTGNWYAMRSSDDGKSWHYVSPYSKFPKLGGGFCCDQYALTVHHKDMVIWLLQYGAKKGTGLGTHRIAVLNGATNVGKAKASCYYDLPPELLKYPKGSGFDFPHLAHSDAFLYLSTNVYDIDGNASYIGTAVARLPLDGMKACKDKLQVDYYRPDNGSARLTYGAKSTMYWAQHKNTTCMRVSKLDDKPFGGNKGVLSEVEVTRWYRGTSPSRGPDGRDWLAHMDNRILGAFTTDERLGFLWPSKPNKFGFVDTRVAVMNHDPDVVYEATFRDALMAYAYPSVAVNRNAIAGTIGAGGLKNYPGVQVWTVGDVTSGDTWLETMSPLVWVAWGKYGPAGGRFGDYFTTQVLPNGIWMATAMAQETGPENKDNLPRNVRFASGKSE